LGAPPEPATVAVWSAGATEPVRTTTSPDGGFSVRGVSVPYDVLLQRESLSLLVLGVRAVEPTFTWLSNRKSRAAAVRVSLPWDQQQLIDCGTAGGEVCSFLEQSACGLWSDSAEPLACDGA